MGWFDNNALAALVVLPAVGAAMVFALGVWAGRRRAARGAAVAVALLELVLTAVVIGRFLAGANLYRADDWVRTGLGLDFAFGMGPVHAAMAVISALGALLALASYAHRRRPLFAAAVLLLESALMAMACTADLLVFVMSSEISFLLACLFVRKRFTPTGRFRRFLMGLQPVLGACILAGAVGMALVHYRRFGFLSFAYHDALDLLSIDSEPLSWPFLVLWAGTALRGLTLALVAMPPRRRREAYQRLRELAQARGRATPPPFWRTWCAVGLLVTAYYLAHLFLQFHAVLSTFLWLGPGSADWSASFANGNAVGLSPLRICLLYAGVLLTAIGGVAALRRKKLGAVAWWLCLGFIGSGVISQAFRWGWPASPGRNYFSELFCAGFFQAVVAALALAGMALCLAYVRRSGEPARRLADLAGLRVRQPGTAAAMGVCLLALASMLLTGGFFGKVFLLGSLMRAGLYYPAIALLMATALTAVACLRVIAAMLAPCPSHPRRPSKPMPGLRGQLFRMVITADVTAIVILGILPQLLMEPLMSVVK